jgi:amino acid adenylation domain-containing protein/non-ribosomal peptide synthase protein (TIGR01720 family)
MVFVYDRETLKYRDYWLSKLPQSMEETMFPPDSVSPSFTPQPTATIRTRLNGELPIEVMKVCKQSDYLLHAFYIAVIKVCLYKYTGQKSLVVGTPTYRSQQNVISHNLLAIYDELDSGSSFKNWLRSIRETLVEAYEHAHYPLEKLISDMEINEDQCLFDIVAMVETIHDRHQAKVEKQNMVFILHPEEDSFVFELEYRSSLYSQEAAETILKHCIKIMEEVIRCGLEIKISKVSLLSEGDKLQQQKSDDTAQSYSENIPIHRIFEDKARQFPYRVAVWFGEHRMTYKELDRRANQVSVALAQKGVGKDTVVGLITKRSLEMMIGILGILKAGGAYLPIDPDLPLERIQYMLDDSKASVLLLQHDNLRGQFPFDGVKISLDDERLYQETMVENYESSNSAPNGLAYVIYTSGSSGKPKGVMIEHYSLINRLEWMQREYELSSKDIILHKTPFTFDVSVWELFLWILGGASVAMLEPEGEKYPDVILREIENRPITALHFVPSMFHAFLEHVETIGNKDALLPLKWVFTSGEALSTHHVKRFYSVLQQPYNTRLINLYGPTEATIDVTYYECSNLDSNITAVPIGKPIQNIQIYIVDTDGNPQPTGVPGELCIAGVGLARGYVNRQDLTNDKFVMNPFPGVTRMYKTGDLAKWMDDGNIEYLGRLDEQVKIRGFRIELGEIESAIYEHEDIKEAIVVKHFGANGQESLCAYYTSYVQLPESELRKQLAKTLPEYMIPSYFIALEALPLTFSGKVNKKALPNPSMRSDSNNYVVPVSELEQTLASVWESVLGVKRVGLHDNFFKLGGDSIKGIQVCSRLYNLGYKLDMKVLFRHATISEVIPYLQKLDRLIDQRAISGPMELMPIQSWFFEQQFWDKHHWNQAIMLHNPNGFDESNVGKAFEGIIVHHDALRTIFTLKDGKYTPYNQGVDTALYTLEVTDFRGFADIELLNSINGRVKAIQSSINLESGPLVKLGLFKTDEGDHLLIVIHHLVVDGVSWRILLEDFTAGYRQLGDGEPLKFPFKTNSLQEWSNRLHEYAQSSELLKQLEYWSHIEQQGVSLIPKDYAIEESYVCDSAMVTIELDEEETKQLLTRTNHVYHTEIVDILLTALGLAVFEWSGINNIAVTLEGHGREEILPGLDINRTIGWFTSQYPVVLDISKTYELSYQIKKIKEIIKGIPQKGIGYGILRYVTDTGHTNGVQLRLDPEISFNYLGQFDQNTEDSEIMMSPFSAGSNVNENSKRKSALDINGMIAGGHLSLMFNYNGKEYESDTISGLAASFKSHLQRIIQHCTNRQTVEVTPSDIIANDMNLDTLIDMQRKWSKVAVIQDVYPLTPLQSGMYFHHVYDPDSDAYFEQTCFSLQGSFDVELFERSLNKVVERHEVFRTVFDTVSWNQPVQIVLNKRHYAIDYEDISTMAEKGQYLQHFKEKDKKRGFNLTDDFLMRVSVLKKDISSYEIVWSFHHILMDGWCISLLAEEIFYIYDCYQKGTEPVLSETYSYRLFMEWLQSQDREQASQYWQQYLAEYEQRANLLYKHKKTGVYSYEIAENTLYLSSELTEKLINVASDHQVTMNTLLQTAWGLLLQKHNNTRDVVFGTVVSGRPAEVHGIEKMIGLFINTIPVRCISEEGVTFADCLISNQKSALSSGPYDYYPLYEIQSQSIFKQDLFDHILIFENFPTEQVMENANQGSNDMEAELGIQNVDIFEQTNYDFNVIIVPGTEYMIKFKYNEQVYSRVDVEKIQLQLMQILNQAAEHPNTAIKDLTILSDWEKETLIHKYNATSTVYPKEIQVFKLFEQQAEVTPNQLAAKYGDSQITYSELNIKANQLARYLKNRGLSNNQYVAVLADHSIELIIGILASLKAGGTYVPIDPNLPSERISTIMTDCGARFLLTQSDLSHIAETGPEIILLDDLSLYRGNCDNLEVDVEREDLAYVIFTSGTTGRPKGSMITHQGLTNYIWWAKGAYAPEGLDFPLYSSISFDLTVTSIFVPLITGNTIVIYKDEDKGALIRQIIEDDQVDIIKLTPTHLQLLVDCECRQSRVRKLIVGGEALSDALARRVYEKFGGDIRIYNEYGPTETVVGCMIYEYDPEQTKTISVPIGRPADNVRIYVLDDHRNPVPFLVTGEIYIAGDGVSKGYLNREELTAEKFVPNPFAPGERMYRTGDQARWLPDGNLEYLGRMDDQVKIRGYRIEPGEIEAQLLRLKGVKEAVVVVRQDRVNEDYLCAYVVMEEGGQTAELRAGLTKYLPGYMIPSYFVALEQLPLTANGKLDRKALPEPGESAAAQAAYVAPRTELEARLAEIWERALGVERVGMMDHFFERGGHSLRATTLVAQIHKELHINVPLRTVFEFPTLGEFAEAVAGMEKQQYASIEPVEKRDYYPVSSAQKRMYILNQLEVGQVSYNMPGIYLIEGPLDKERMEAAFSQLIARHESLRTSFEIVAGEPVQRVQEEAAFSISFDRAEKEEEIARRAESFVRPFDLGQAPLLRVGLIEKGQNQYVLLFDMHHIISDGLSNQILINEFMRLYAGQTLPELRIQYRDYAAWQRKLAASETMRKQEAYWLETFAGEIPVLDLPTDYTRPPVQRFEGDSIGFRLEKEIVDGLERIAQETGATMYMVLLAAYTALLHRYTGQEDIVVGTPIAGRPHADLEELIGMFVGTLAMRNYPAADKPFRAFVEEVKERALRAYENQDYAFEELVEQLDVRKDLSRNPLFDTMFVMQKVEEEDEQTETDELTFMPYGPGTTSAKFDLTINAVVSDEHGVDISIQYRAGLFRKETMERFGGHFAELLQAVAKQPELLLREICILTDRERSLVLSELNDTNTDYPRETTVYSLFEAQAMRTPEQTALVAGQANLTYRELNERSNRLAHDLRKRGVKPDHAVGILAGHSLELVVGILAIMKAGGAYIPIDPDYPKERISYMLENSEAAFLLVQPDLRKLVSGYYGEVLELVADGEAHDGLESLEPVATSEHLAYIIYTSGSTGKPKGSMITHQGLTNYIWWAKGAYAPEGLDFPLYSSISFDLTVTSIFVPLITGNTIVIYKDEDKGALIRQIIEDDQVDIIKLTPTHLQLLVDCECRQSRVRKLIVGGEALSDALARRVYEKFGGDIRIYNEYGPTETVVGCMIYEYDPEQTKTISVPIGRPADNVRIYVLDDHRNPVPFLVTGEIYIAGDGVSKGYLNREELTAEKFVPNPFAPGERMYRTGDQARWLPDGNLEYLGRMDDQVKIRGYRIEPGEIEAQLLRLKGVKEAVVVVRQDRVNEDYLCAYVVMEEGGQTAELRAGLTKYLPGYMIPSYFVALEQLPLTANGKLDRKALPEPGESAAAQAAYVAPRTELEARLAEIWERALGVERVGMMDHFFERGGHSLRATTLVAQIHKELHINVPLRTVFEFPTLGEFAEAVAGMEKQQYASIEPVEKRDYYPVSSAQKRMYILNQLEVGQVSYNMPGIYLIEGPLDKERMEAAFSQLIARHESLRTSFEIVAGEPVQRVQEEAAFSISFDRAEKEEEIARRAESFVRPFDLGQAPLLRVGLIEKGQNQYVLLFDMHHIISDGLSNQILINEFMRLYAGQTLPELRIQYRDYAAWQRKLAASETMRKQEAYWLETFAGEIPVLDLPTDYTRPPVQRFEGDSIGFRLEKEIVDGLERIAQETGATMYMVLLAAYTALLHRYTGQEDIVVGTPIAGRPHADLEELIGMFVGTLAMRNYPAADKPFRAFVEEVKERALRAYENQDYAFEELVEQLDVRKDLSRNPLFDTMFVMQKVEKEDEHTETGELTFMPYGTGTTSAKFDLTFRANEIHGELACSFIFCTALFRKETIQAMAEHFAEMLRNFTRQPETGLGQAQMWSKDDIEHLMTTFNNTLREYPELLTVHRQFEAQVKQTPDRVAIVSGDRRLTYRELNGRANQVARRLRKQGIAANSIVGLLAEPSLEMIIGILGILKAGAAYMPLEPEQQNERVAYMLLQSGVQVIVSHHSCKNIYTGSCEMFVLDDADVLAEDSTDLELVNTGDDLVYVIFTSGTTGVPKGVPIRHRNLLNYTSWFAEQTELTSEDKTVLSSSYSFDLGYTSIYPTLLNGGELHLLNKDEYMNPLYFWPYMEAQGITYLKLTPSLFKVLVRDVYRIKDAVCRLRWIVLGGEKIIVEDIETYHQLFADTRFMNHYGPTESTIGCIAQPIDMLNWQAYKEITVIGKPIANTKVYVVDRKGRLQPTGAVGEIYVGGAGVASGYLNNPELTEEKFIYADFASELLYRTGDLGRYLPDGCIQLAGRVDEQIKIRGYRVEPEEIQKQLLKMNDVKECMVAVLKDTKNDVYLCAYVVVEGDCDPVKLREGLSRHLPSYMLPSVFVKLDKLPLTANGKVDRGALPAPENYNGALAAYVAPRTDLEQCLVNIWEQVLSVERVGIYDNFFELGGHSLKILEVVHHINQTYDIELPFRVLYTEQTVERVAATISERKYAQYFDQYMTKYNDNGSTNIFCFPPILGFGVRYKELADALNDTAVIYGMDFIEAENRVSMYAEVIIQEQPSGPYVLLGYSVGGNLAFEVCKELERRGHEVSDIIMLDTVKSVHKRETNEQQLQEDLNYLANGLEEEYAKYFTTDAIKQRVINKTRSYMMYRNELVNAGEVDARLHCLLSTDSTLRTLRETNYRWDDSTKKAYREYEGYGNHEEMLQLGYLEGNAEVIKQIMVQRSND